MWWDDNNNRNNFHDDIITLMKYLCFIVSIILLLLFTSCSSTKVVGKQESTIDSTYVAIKSHTDSINHHVTELKDKEQAQTIIKDSIVYVVDTAGNVVYRDRWHYEDRWRDKEVQVHDTVYVKVAIQDSLSLSYTHEKGSEVVLEKQPTLIERIKAQVHNIWAIVMLTILAVLIWRNMEHIIKFFKR